MEVAMRRILAIGLSGGLAACNAQPVATPPAVPQQAQLNCIDLTQVTARRVIPPSAVLFDMAGNVSYRSELVGGCPGAARANGSEIIQTESQSTQLCRNDHIRIYDPVEAKATGGGSFAMCRVGGFTPVPKP
jgi:hypothetical protein